MKVESTKRKYDGAVRGEQEVVISATKEQTDELRAALAVVGKFRMLAAQAGKHKEKDADWTMYRYTVKNDKVIVTIEAGACG